MALLARTTIVASLSALAVAALSACGGEDAKLLPGDTAREITANLDSVKQLTDEGDCVGAESAAAQVGEQIEALGGVDRKLKEALEKGAERLNEVVDECEEAEEPEAVAPAEIPTEETERSARQEGRKGRKEGRKGARKGRTGGGKRSAAACPGKRRRTTRAGKNPAGTGKEGRTVLGWGRIGEPGRKRTGRTVMEAGLLSGRYEIDGRLGSGGMSTVHRATDRILERTVAVKILAEHLSDDDRFVARFRREALAVAKLIHPNIVQVYDTGIDQGRHYIVMEFVEGRSGAQILQSQGSLEPRFAAEIGIQSCAGLDYAHRRGIIHRDVKPGNLMIVGGPLGGAELTVKLTDFGIARAIEQTRITQVGSVVGTAAYLSPEQVRGEEATPATDVYALGVVIYQFLTGRLPYEGSTLAELAVRQQNESPLPPSTYNDEVPETLGGAVLRALEGDTSRRYASADEFAGGLRLGLEGEDVTLPMDEGTAATRVLGGEPRDPPAGRDRPDRVQARPAAAPSGSRAAAPGGPSPIRPRKAGHVLALRQVRPGDGRAGPDRRCGRDRGDPRDRPRQRCPRKGSGGRHGGQGGE